MIFSKILGEVDVREQAWRISRPYIPDDEVIDMDEIEAVDLPVNTMKTVYVHFRCSAAFRELLTSMRPMFAWTQSSRVNPLEEIEFPDYLSPETLEICKEAKARAIEIHKNVHQDAARLELPLGHLTEITVGTDFRSWICFLKSLWRFYPFYYNMYGQPLIEKLAPGKSLEQFKYQPAFREPQWNQWEASLDCDTYEAGNSLVVKDRILISLRTHIVRHATMRIRDDLFWNPPVLATRPSMEQHLEDEFAEVNRLERFKLNDHLLIAIYTPRDIWRKLIEHRSCWLAHFEMYDNFIRTFLEKDEFYFFEELLPCEANADNCPFRKDIQARIAGNDPGFVCPLYGPEFEGEIEKRRTGMGNSFPLSQFERIIKER